MNGRDPAEVRNAIVCDNFSPHLSTKVDTRAGDWAAATTIEIAHTPTNSSWLNRIEAQVTALRYIAWRNRHAHDQRLRDRGQDKRCLTRHQRENDLVRLAASSDRVAG
jgi:hypothetical protein